LYAARVSQSKILYIVAGVAVMAMSGIFLSHAARILPAPDELPHRWKYLIFAVAMWALAAVVIFALIAVVVEQLVRVQLAR
jgi:hypothetical protein